VVQVGHLPQNAKTLFSIKIHSKLSFNVMHWPQKLRKWMFWVINHGILHHTCDYVVNNLSSLTTQIVRYFHLKWEKKFFGPCRRNSNGFDHCLLVIFALLIGFEFKNLPYWRISEAYLHQISKAIKKWNISKNNYTMHGCVKKWQCTWPFCKKKFLFNFQVRRIPIVDAKIHFFLQVKKKLTKGTVSVISIKFRNVIWLTKLH